MGLVPGILLLPQCHNAHIVPPLVVYETYSSMIRFLPLFMGIVPVIGVAAAYWLNVQAGVLPSCMPLWDGCVSISATGRYMPGGMPFRAVLLPQAAFLVILWWLSIEWLKNVLPTSRHRHAIMISGVVGALALIIYATFLGTKQPFYEFMRHIGIYFYFLGTALSQLLLTIAMPTSRLRTAMLWVIGTPFGLGLVNLAQKLVLSNPDRIENSIEWTSAILMQFWFVLLYVAWRKSGLVVAVQTDSLNIRR